MDTPHTPVPPSTPPRRSKVRTALVMGAVGVSAAAVVGLGLPALAATQDDSTTAAQAVGDRLARIKDALSGLVTDGTITQKQADAVAKTLDEKLPERGDGPRGGPMGGPLGRELGAELSSLATTLKTTPADLLAQLRDGTTLAEIAKAKGVSTDTVVAAIVKAATARIDDAVTDGHLTAAQATTLKAGLEEKVTTFVTEGGPLHGLGLGPMGPGGPMGRMHDRDGDDEGAPTPPSAPAPAPSASTESSSANA